MLVTEEWLESFRTERNGYTKEQVLGLGLEYPLRKAWKENIVGTKITEEQRKRFEEGRTKFAKSTMRGDWRYRRRDEG